jgi:hypothetical protein
MAGKPLGGVLGKVSKIDMPHTPLPAGIVHSSSL